MDILLPEAEQSESGRDIGGYAVSKTRKTDRPYQLDFHRANS